MLKPHPSEGRRHVGSRKEGGGKIASSPAKLNSRVSSFSGKNKLLLNSLGNQFYGDADVLKKERTDEKGRRRGERERDRRATAAENKFGFSRSPPASLSEASHAAATSYVRPFGGLGKGCRFIRPSVMRSQAVEYNAPLEIGRTCTDIPSFSRRRPDSVGSNCRLNGRLPVARLRRGKGG